MSFQQHNTLRAKLTPEDVMRIRELYAGGQYSQAYMARHSQELFGKMISLVTVGRICREETWRQLPGVPNAQRVGVSAYTFEQTPPDTTVITTEFVIEQKKKYGIPLTEEEQLVVDSKERVSSASGEGKFDGGLAKKFFEDINKSLPPALKEQRWQQPQPQLQLQDDPDAVGPVTPEQLIAAQGAQAQQRSQSNASPNWEDDLRRGELCAADGGLPADSGLQEHQRGEAAQQDQPVCYPADQGVRAVEGAAPGDSKAE